MHAADDNSMPFLDLHGVDFQARPYEVLRACRAQHACARTPQGIAVLGYAELQELLAHRQFRAPGADLLAMQGITSGPIVELMNTLLLNSHGDTHERLRRLVSRAFTLRSVEGFRPRIAAIASELVDGLVRRDSCDFMADFAEPFAGRVLFEFVGIPLTAMGKIVKCNPDIVLMFGFEVSAHAARIEATLREVGSFVAELAEARRREPREDLLSALVTTEESNHLLTPAELVAMIITLLSAGTGTVSRQLGNGVATFVEHPEQWQALAAERELAAPAVEEILRFSSSVILGMPRIATAPLSWNGRSLEPGACLLPLPTEFICGPLSLPLGYTPAS